MKPNDLKLLLLFLALAGAVLLRAGFKSHGFVSPDSVYYMQAAQSMLEGKGLMMTIPETETSQARDVEFTIWPAGYPLLIAGTSLVTNLTVFWASKLVNILSLGGCLLLLRFLNKHNAWMPGLIFCSYANLQIFSYTWSEAPFLFFMLLFIISFYKAGTSESGKWWALLVFSAAAMFLCRYIGVVSVLFIGVGSIIYRKDPKKSIRFLSAGILPGLLIIAYLYHNYLLTGSVTGWARPVNSAGSSSKFLFDAITSTLNEFFILLHYNRKYGVGAFVALALLQLLWMALLYFKIGKKTILLLRPAGDLPKIMLWFAATYYILLMILMFRFPYYIFDYRVMAPASLPFFIAILISFGEKNNSAESKLLEKNLLAFFLFSLLVNTGHVLLSV